MTSIGETSAEAAFVENRERLVRVAYRILGSAADAEDVVQEAWLRWARVEHEVVRDPLAFLIRTTARLALDRLRRVKARRETYTGVWLPEPLATGSVEDEALASEDVSMAMLLVLETLSPLERAVFVIREAFELSYAEIAEMLGRSEPAIRQLAQRARRHVEERRPRFEPDAAARDAVTRRFVAATENGDLAALLDVLAPGVTLIADGGGRVRAPLLPVAGAEKVARFMLRVAARELPSVRVEITAFNGAPGILVSSATGPAAALAFDVGAGRVQKIYLVGNPDKLAAMSRATGGVASSE